MHQDAAAAAAVETLALDVRESAEALLCQVAGGFDAREPDSATTLRLQTTLVDALRHIFTVANRIAGIAYPPPRGAVVQ